MSEADLVILNGANSLDPDGIIASYAWEQTSGPAVAFSDGNSTAHCIFTVPEVGQYGESFIFQLTVTDGGGLQARDTVVIRAHQKESANKIPVADAIAYIAEVNPPDPADPNTWKKSIKAGEGTSVTLDGAGSRDSENKIVSWLWQQKEGPHVNLINATSPVASFTSPSIDQGGKSLVFTLTIEDDIAQKSTDMVLVNVLDSNSTNEPPVALAGADREVDEGGSVALSGSAIDQNDSTDINTSSYLWEQVSGIPVQLTGTGTNRSFTAPNVKEDSDLIFRFTAADKSGLKSIDTIKVKVLWRNAGPLADAGSDLTVAEGLKVMLDGSKSSDSDDGIASYLWERIDQFEATVTLSSNKVAKPIFIAPDVSSREQLIFRLTVADKSGNKAQDTVVVNVIPQSKPPKADAGPDRAVTWGAADVTLDGTGSYDPDGDTDIVSYLWQQIGGIPITLYQATTDHPNFTAPNKGDDESDSPFQSLVFLLTVKDKDGLESSDSVVVNVTDDPGDNPKPPLSDAGQEQTVSPGSLVRLDGSKSSDPGTFCEVRITNNHFLNDDSKGIGNAVAVRKNPDSNCLLSFNANNLENLNGNFLVYLYGWMDDDPELQMKDNWWGTTSADQTDSMIYDQDEDEHVPQVSFLPARSIKVGSAGSALRYPPKADAGGDQPVEPDKAITLDGSNTHDPDRVMSYSWVQVEGQTVILQNAQSPSASFIAPSLKSADKTDEALKFKLTVTDPEGFFDADEVTVTLTKGSKKEVSHQPDSGCFISSILVKMR